MTTLRAELESLPTRMKALPVDARGYPVPWFVGWVERDGQQVPEFRAMDYRKLVLAIKQRLCWVCGQPLGRWLAFPIGPMCAITRTTGEPPAHRDCAEWSIRNCPFLSQPRQVRREDALPDEVESAGGIPIRRNPGVTCLWITRGYEVFDDGRGKLLITVGEPETITWWREGRAATRAEVQESIDTGLPILLNVAKTEGPLAVRELEKQVLRVEQYLR
jgi:hypothetical protein